jgi:hypothetical protein
MVASGEGVVGPPSFRVDEQPSDDQSPATTRSLDLAAAVEQL